MNTRDELMERAESLLADLNDLHTRYGNDPELMPAGQRQRAENLQRAIDAVGKDMDAYDARERMREYAIATPEARVSGSAPDDIRPVARTRSNPWGGLGDGVFGESPDGYRQRALDALELVPGIPTENRERLTEMVDSDPSARSAMYVTATSDPEYDAAFRAILKDPVRGHLTWTGAQRDAYARVESMRAALSLTDANGGYLVSLTSDPLAVLTNVGSTNPFRRIARIETTATDNWNGTTSAGVTAEWLAEATEAADASPTFGRVTITPEKLSAYVFGSYEMLQDSNFIDQLPRLLADSFDNAEAAGFATGAGHGSTQPNGVVTAVAAVTASRVSPTTAGTFTSASVADIYKVHNALTSRSRNHSTMAWIANNTILNIIRTMDTYGGSSFWANLGDGTPPRLLGAPVYESSAMDAVVTTGSNILLAGSFVDYAVVDRIGTTLVYQPMITGENGRPTGQAGWFAFKRTSGDCLNPDAFRTLQL